MILQAPRVVTIVALSMALLLAAVSGAQAQRGHMCRQLLLILIVMIDTGEQGKSRYRKTARTVVEACGPPGGAKPGASSAAFGKELCGGLARTMVDSIEKGKLNSPQFAEARDEFAGKCIGSEPAG